MVKHTPGPWEVSTSNPSYINVFSTYHGGICQIPADNNHRQEHEANAKLISAAPELLEALKGMLFAFRQPNERKSKIQESAIIYADIAIKNAETWEK